MRNRATISKLNTHTDHKKGEIKILKIQINKKKNPNHLKRQEFIKQTFDKTFSLKFGWYSLTRDLHAIPFRQAVGTLISKKSDKATDPFQSQNVHIITCHASFNTLKIGFIHCFFKVKSACHK